MQTEISYALLGIGAFTIVLGFVALLRQKTYIDANSNSTEVEVPFFGRMKTNLPALLFVFIGAVLVSVPAFRSATGIKVWEINGPAVQLDDGTEIKKEDWDNHFKIRLVPDSFNDVGIFDTKNKGRFTFKLPLIEGVDFEKAVDHIVFELVGEPYFTCSLFPEEELKAYHSNKTNSIISSAGGNYREFRTIKLSKPTDLNKSCKD